MPIIINSPYSGRPVKIRDEDLGRAVRDEEKRVFYVVPRSNGEGYYAAITRKGSPKDEERYDAMQSKMDTVQDQVTEQHQAAIHDATGRRKRSPLPKLIAKTLLVAALVVAGYAAYVQWGGGEWPTFVEEMLWPDDSASTTPENPGTPTP